LIDLKSFVCSSDHDSMIVIAAPIARAMQLEIWLQSRLDLLMATRDPDAGI
jgi:hypothetical protein